MNKLKENLLMLRKSKGLVQKDLAAHLNMSISAYNKYEVGNAEPTINNLISIADFYSVSLDELVGREFRKESKELHNILMKKEIESKIKPVVKEVISEIINEKENEIKETVLKKLDI